MDALTISRWTSDHRYWSKLVTLTEHLGQTNWIECHADWHEESTMLVAHINAQPVGFLRYVIQAIGSDAGLDPVQFQDQTLREAKVLAFGVVKAMRRQGIGTRLQQTLIDESRRAGCYQIRSHSSLDNKANHQLKLSLGFAVHPLPSTPEKDGFYFVLPL